MALEDSNPKKGQPVNSHALQIKNKPFGVEI